MRPAPLSALLLALAACPSAPPDSGDTADPLDSGPADDTADTGDAEADPGNVAWRAIGSGSWYSEYIGSCDEVVTAIVTTPDAVAPWFEGVHFSGSPQGSDPEEIPTAVDWTSEVVVLGAIQCVNTGKMLSVTAIDEADGTLHVDFHLLHPGIDGALVTTYWTAAAIPADLAGSTLTYTLTEAYAPEPE